MNRKHNPSASLIERLEQDYTGHLQASAAEEAAALRETLLSQKPLPEQVIVRDHSLGFLLVLPLLMLPVNLISWGILFDEASQPGFSFSWGWAVFLLGLCAITAGAIYLPIMKHRYQKVPLFVISLEGIRFCNVARIIPWEAVDHFSIVRILFSVIIEFHLREDYPPVKWSLSWPAPARYDRKKHIIVAAGSGVTPGYQKLVETIDQYHTQSKIRARLAELGEDA